MISAERVSKKYGTIRALEDFSLQVAQGELRVLVGPDGSGKTSFMRILCNLTRPDGGTARIGGFDVRSQFQKVKPLLGYMPQLFSLYPDLSVEENLRFYAGMFGMSGKRYETKRDELYEFSKLAPFARRRASALSGGMKQKLALSCALLHQPKLLILDEPTTGVDPLSRKQFWEILQQLKDGGVTLLVSTPYMDEAERADKVTLVYDGKQLGEGTPSALAAQYEGTIYQLNRQLATPAMERLEQSSGFRARRFGAAVHLSPVGAKTLETAGSQLLSIGIAISELQSVVPTLEDRFIQLMERQL